MNFVSSFLLTKAVISGLADSQTANMLCALTIGDTINGSTTNKDLVINGLDTMFTLFPNISHL